MQRAVLGAMIVGFVSLGCGDGEGDGVGGSGAGGAAGLEPDAQTPPQSAAAIEGWIAEGHYQDWQCEPTSHEARSPSPHGFNRICSNDLLTDHDSGPYPAGAASVKELFDETGMDIVGYAVALHVSAGASGDTWYWFEKVSGGVVADGLGDDGPANTICVGCHQGAGSDAMHSGHDMVYTQVE